MILHGGSGIGAEVGGDTGSKDLVERAHVTGAGWLSRLRRELQPVLEVGIVGRLQSRPPARSNE